jgi:hypothetical protein
MNFCPKCGEHLFKGTSYCLACHYPVTPPQPVQPLDSDDDESTRLAPEDYTTHVSPEPPRKPTRHSTGPLPPHESAPLPQYTSAPLPPPRRDWTVYLLACAVGLLVAFLVIAAVALGTGAVSLYNPFRSEEAKRETPAAEPQQQPAQNPPPFKPPNYASEYTPEPVPTRAAPTPPPARLSNANVSASGYNANVYYPPSGNANYYPPQTPRPQAQVIISGTIQVQNLQARYYQFSVPPGQPATLRGSFTAWGGNNDIDVLVMPASQFAGWQNLGRYYSLYNSGYIHQGGMLLHLPPGDYVLVFTNRQAILTSKTVQAYAQLSFE